VTSLAAGSALAPEGPVARAMADLWWLMLGLGAAVFVLFAVLLVVGLFRHPPQQTGSDGEPWVGRWIVGGGVVMPLIVLTVVFAATVYAMRVVPSTPPADALVVEIVGHQWWYEVSYPDEDVSTVNELHIPVGRPVALELTSADVIHSFWVPALGGKLDLLPDGTNTLVLQADETGEHQALCAEFCGLEHAHMKLRVVAEPADAFSAWLADQQENGG
jgi:cytochrome c oxidase subunit II